MELDQNKKQIYDKLSQQHNEKTDEKEEMKYFNLNGGLSDFTSMQEKYLSTGVNDEYWFMQSAGSHHTHQSCVQPKGCNVYPPMRVLHKSQDISCGSIMSDLMPKIYACVDKFGIFHCPLFLDEGYFRVVFQIDDYVLKIMKPKSFGNPRDLLRHIRESILLYYLQSQENIFMETNGHLFVSMNQKRASTYVRELGHCIYPNFISVSRRYNMTLHDFVANGLSQLLSIKRLVEVSIDIVSGIEILHSLPGGGFSHTDLTSQQFLLDNDNRVFINDFNRGKFGSYVFGQDYNESDFSVTKCWYCGHRSRGPYRSPEEHNRLPLNEKLDIFSVGLIIWELFAGVKPFPDASYKDIQLVVGDLYERPPLPSNMPSVLKELIKQCLFQNPRQRPNAKDLKLNLMNIYKFIEHFTQGNENMMAKDARKKHLWKDTNHPDVERMFGGSQTEN